MKEPITREYLIFQNKGRLSYHLSLYGTTLSHINQNTHYVKFQRIFILRSRKNFRWIEHKGSSCLPLKVPFWYHKNI